MTLRRSGVALLLALSVIARGATVVTVAGTGAPGLVDGPVTSAEFNRPTWLDIVPDGRPDGAGKQGDIYVIDRANHAIRKISDGAVSTYQVARNYTDRTDFPFDFGGPFGGGIVIEPEGSGCGASIYDRGFFVSVTGAHQIVLVSFEEALADRDSPVIVGMPNVAGAADGPVYTALLNMPTGVALSPNYPRVDAFHRWIDVADTGNNVIRRIGFGLSGEGCPRPYQLATLAGVAGVVTTVAGEAGVRGTNDGGALAAHFDSPSGIDIDAHGNLSSRTAAITRSAS